MRAHTPVSLCTSRTSVSQGVLRLLYMAHGQHPLVWIVRGLDEQILGLAASRAEHRATDVCGAVGRRDGPADLNLAALCRNGDDRPIGLVDCLLQVAPQR